MELSKNVLLYDSLESDQIPLYDNYPVLGQPLLYSPITDTIIQCKDCDSVLVPVTKNEVDWDKVLMRIIDRCSENTEKLKTSSLDTELIMEIESKFDELDAHCTQVILHPSKKSEIMSQNFDIHETDLCPENQVYFLPSPQFMGVFVNRDNTEKGMAIMNHYLVIPVDLT